MKTSLPKLLITGGNGQLAQAMQHHALAKNYQLIPCTHSELDITIPESINRAIDKYTPDIIINTAAYTAVDKAESEPELAMQINHEGAKNLAIACSEANLPLIHISTDYVFDGNAPRLQRAPDDQIFFPDRLAQGSASRSQEQFRLEKKYDHPEPYSEANQPNPINLYGLSKYQGEEAIREHCDQHIILRVSGVFSEYGNNFAKTILRLAKEKKELRIVNDQTTCPTYAGDIAEAIFTITGKMNHWGTYHFCSNKSFTWYEFAVAICPTANIKPIPTTEYPTPAKRPLYSVLNCDKILKDYHIKKPTLNEGLIHVTQNQPAASNK